MLRVAVIGFGKMGQLRARVVSTYGRGEVVAVVDPSLPPGFADHPIAPTADEVLADPTIDAVFIATPNVHNEPLTIAAMRAGKHVFCEKPPALDAAGVERIREVEAATGRTLMFGFNHRHHSSIKHMKRVIDDRSFGDVLWMRGRYGKSVDQSFFDNWRSKKALAGGGILIDQGIHMVDLFSYLGGPFDRTQAVVSNRYWQADIEDNVFAILSSSTTGVVASLHSTMTQWRHLFSLEVFLSRGYMVLNGLRTSSKTYGEEILCIAKNRTTAPAATFDDEERITYHEDVSWRSEVDHFFDAIETGTPVAVGNSADALTLMRTIDAIYATGRGAS